MVLAIDLMIVFFCWAWQECFLFFDLLREDLVRLLMTVLLPLSGVVCPDEAVASLSSNAVVFIINE